MYRVLFMEDEPIIREVLVEYMEIAGYSVFVATDGEEAMRLVDHEDLDLAILDIMVPKHNGFEVLNYIRLSHNKHIGVLMLSALDDVNSQVHAFNDTADDYIIKPVSPIILLKRMETLLRRVKSQISWQEGLKIDHEGYRALYNGIPLKLTLSEFLLLQVLYQSPQRVFSREQLILNIFNEDYIGNDRIIDAHIKNLRKKLPFNCIKTIVGVGYQFQKEEAYEVKK